MEFDKIEKKWQKKWHEKKLFETPRDPRKDKFYLLEMFAYPSGDIHMGHFRNYSIGDLIWRYMHMKGKKILHPFGWDSFGLPAEQAAIKKGIHPGKWTEENITSARETLKAIGVSYDWDREVITSSPDYYRWTQWIFLKLFEMGLAYRKEALVNWCPKCNTVLANEQVIGGCCWRHDETPVERKTLKQWFFRITDYAQRLLDSLDDLPEWNEPVKIMQRNWIGRSEGANIDFEIVETKDKLPIFTTRPDTVFGVTFMAIAPEAELMKKILPFVKNRDKIEEYISSAIKKSEIERVAENREKDGVDTGLRVRNPFTDETVPLFVADYVLAGYGSGAVMAVPAHDQRDFEFAKKYGLKIKVVINPPGKTLVPDEMTCAYIEPGIMMNSAHFDGMLSTDAIPAIIEYGAKKGFAEKKIQFKLRDWLISRQRYWGAPIPIIHCNKCGTVPVPEKDLPVLLPFVDDYLPKGRSPLADVPSFMNVSCPQCGGDATRDPDTMDTFVCSSWYFIRYVDPHNDKAPFDNREAKKWLPVDMYIGGREHATGHLLYFRFITKVLFDAGLIDVDEPVIKMFNHGMVADKNGEIMSKSKGNVISPIDVVSRYGVDVTRTAMFFFAPPDHEIAWNEECIKGSERFLSKVERLIKPGIDKTKTAQTLHELDGRDAELYKLLNRTIKAVTEDIDSMQYNTAIARMMELSNELTEEDMRNSRIAFQIADSIVRLLAPFAPHLAEELNERIGYDCFVVERPWVSFDPEAVEIESVEIGVQVCGKLRGTITIKISASEEEAVEKALLNPSIAKYVEGKTVVKTIFVKGKILNLIVQ